MVVRDEGKDLMLGMLKVILMFKKVRKIVICVEVFLGSVVLNLFKIWFYGGVIIGVNFYILIYREKFF